MLKHRNINKLCWAALALTLIAAVLFMSAAASGRITVNTGLGYEARLFDTAQVHTIDIVMDDWETFLATCTSEEYSSCTVVIDGEKYGNVGIRGKGNTSLMQVASYGNNRYSFKVEFDKYNSGTSYYGLDKLSLNNIISDNTYMKDYLTYQMMQYMGVAAPLCSFVYISVNGEEWGLYLAVEGVEDGFLQRNYGRDYGELYKPDSMSFGGGRGNGADFSMSPFMNNAEGDESEPRGGMPEGFSPPEGFNPGDMPEGFAPPEMGGDGGDAGRGGNRGGGMGGMGSSDVKLQYTDDDPASYANIFNNAKTEITDADQARLIASLKELSEGKAIEEVVDVDAVIKYLVAHNFVCNTDSYTGTMVHNYYLYEEDGVLSMIPWDYNLAFGAMGMGGGRDGGSAATGATADINSPIDSPVSGGSIEDRPMVAWIFESGEYTALYHQYYAAFIEGYFESGHFETMLEETIALISPYIEKDPTAFCTYEEFQKGAETLREFCLLRAESISGQLDGSIPSTEEGQSADNSALIDASHISISDMGSFMGGGGPGEGDGGRPGGQAPTATLSTATPTEGGTGGSAMPGMEGGWPERSDMPGMMGGGLPTGSAGNVTQQWLLVAGSVLLLGIGLFFAKKYKR